MLPLIGTYSYNFGKKDPSGAPTRRVCFYECDNHTVKTVVEAKINGEWKLIADLCEEQVYVEGESAASRAARLAESRMQGIPIKDFEFKYDKKFSELSLDEKKNWITQIKPNGSNSIVISYRPGKDPKVEDIWNISFSTDSGEPYFG